MVALTKLTEVSTQQTRNGNTRFVVRDADGREYTTFRAEIGTRARELQGYPVRISYHEEQRGQYTNVYLDEVERAAETASAAEDAADASDAGDAEVQEAAWRTAVEAAPWLVGQPEEAQVAPDELYDTLKPFEERVAADIERSRHPPGE
jgi:hypothetical protein